MSFFFFSLDAIVAMASRSASDIFCVRSLRPEATYSNHALTLPACIATDKQNDAGAEGKSKTKPFPLTIAPREGKKLSKMADRYKATFGGRQFDFSEKHFEIKQQKHTTGLSFV